MGKKIMRCCALAATGALVFGFLGGGCLGAGWKQMGLGFANGVGAATGADLTQTYVLHGLTQAQDITNQLNANEAWQAICNVAAPPAGCAGPGSLTTVFPR